MDTTELQQAVDAYVEDMGEAEHDRWMHASVTAGTMIGTELESRLIRAMWEGSASPADRTRWLGAQLRFMLSTIRNAIGAAIASRGEPRGLDWLALVSAFSMLEDRLASMSSTTESITMWARANPDHAFAKAWLTPTTSDIPDLITKHRERYFIECMKAVAGGGDLDEVLESTKLTRAELIGTIALWGLDYGKLAEAFDALA